MAAKSNELIHQNKRKATLQDIMNDEPYPINYEFQLDGGERRLFKILLDPETISIIRPELKSKPDWTRLEYKQCKCCPLRKEVSPDCPLAVNAVEIVEAFKGMVSSDNCIVRCTTPERTYLKKTSVMVGLSSILGIIMATSNCPVMDFLKPMARFHLPFSTSDETIARSTSLYLLRQYFEYKNNKTPDFDLKELNQNYAKVQEVNKGFLTRINSIVEKDADNNAVITLNSLAQILSMEIDYNLDSLEYLFTPRT